MNGSVVKFSVLCSLFDGIHRVKSKQKKKGLTKFLECADHRYFDVLRLILPSLDKERGNYGLKEAVLAKCLAEALGLSEDSPDAQKLLNWRKGGTSTGSNAGNFPNVAFEILQRRQPVTSKGLTIKDLNDLLDRLAAADKREEKVAVLTDMTKKTNAAEMRFIIMIILKDLKLGISEKTVFRVFHRDAEDLFNVTCDLKLVCEKLHNPKQQYNRKDIEVGKAVRPQLAARAASVEDAWKKLKGKQVIVECKFDGDRIQIHKDGKHIHFFSRNFIDHQPLKEGIADVLLENILPEKCILDGEILAWDHLNNRFADFGTIRGAAKAAKDGLETSEKLCYVAFDLLYHGSTSVIHLPLRNRQELLQKLVRPVKNRLELLLPYAGRNNQRSFGDQMWSIIANSAEVVHRFFQETVENREEGIILKDLDSKWEPSDRSGKWLKLKPDYVHTGSDLDVLIIGGYFGSGRRGGQVAQFLLGIAEKPKEGQYPTRFISFCKVGSGLTDEESEHLVQKLYPYFRRNEKNSRPPSCYTVTNNAKERPDVWVDQPDKSVILQIASDIRTIDTDVFAAPYGLRFPRISRVRYDKPWYDCLDIQGLVDMVNSGGGSMVDSKGYGKLEKKPKQSKRQKKAGSGILHLVPSHMQVTDVSHVTRTTQIFTDLDFYFVNTPEEYSRDSLHKLVVENGGSFSMNLNDGVTHAIAAERKGIKFQAAQSSSHGDVIHHSWIIDSCAAKTLLPVRPKYFLHMSQQTKEKMKADVDDYGDYYFVDIDTSDLSQLFENIDPRKLVTDCEKLAHYKKKYCPSSTFCQFSNSHFYFHKPIHSSNPDSQMVAEITLKRQKLEVSMHAGALSETLDNKVTHIIVFTSSEQSLPFRTIFESVSHQERRLLMSDKLKILSHQWVDDHVLGVCSQPPVLAKYDLRDATFQYNEKDIGSCLTVGPSDHQYGANSKGDIKKAQGSKNHLGSLAELSKSPPNESLTLENASEHGKRPRDDDNVKTEEGLAVDPRIGREEQTEHPTSLAEIDDRPLKRLVAVKKPSKHRKRPLGDGPEEVSLKPIKRSMIKTIPARKAKEEPKSFAAEEAQLAAPEQKVLIKTEGNCGYQADSVGDLALRGAHSGAGQVAPSHQEDTTFDAFMGEMFPMFSKGQQLPSIPSQGNVVAQLFTHGARASSPAPAAEARNADELPNYGSRSSIVPNAIDTVPTTHNKKKVSYKTIVGDLLKP